jgi:GNAT superfamily N-acetyltransferase
MTDPSLSIEYYDAADTLRMCDSLSALYLTTHADQQHNPWYSPEQFWDRLVKFYAPGRDFGLVVGWLNEMMIGYAFGSPRDDAREIWDMVRSAMPDVPVPEDPEPVYIFREFAVDSSFQGKGHGRVLHNALLKTRPERLAHLLVRPDNIAAKSAYLSWGWKTIGHVQPFSDAPVMDAMCRVLPVRLT